jgi:hypothetical protein
MSAPIAYGIDRLDLFQRAASYVDRILKGEKLYSQGGEPTGIAPSGKLRFGLPVFSPVLVSKNPDGTLGGVSIELAKFVAEKLRVPFEPMMLQNTEHYTRASERVNGILPSARAPRP